MASGGVGVPMKPIVLMFDVSIIMKENKEDKIPTHTIEFIISLIQSNMYIIPFIISSYTKIDEETVSTYTSPFITSLNTTLLAYGMKPFTVFPFAFNKYRNILYRKQTVLNLYAEYYDSIQRSGDTTISLNQKLVYPVYFFSRNPEYVSQMPTHIAESFVITKKDDWFRVLNIIKLGMLRTVTYDKYDETGDEYDTYINGNKTHTSAASLGGGAAPLPPSALSLGGGAAPLPADASDSQIGYTPTAEETVFSPTVLGNNPETPQLLHALTPVSQQGRGRRSLRKTSRKRKGKKTRAKK